MTDQTETTGTGGGRGRALGDELVAIHAVFRKQLGELRQRFAEPAPRDGTPGGALSSPNLEEELRMHCLSFCENLHGHHSIEDAQMLPGLAQSNPELAPVLDRLRREHVVIGRILDEIRALLGEPGRAGPAAALSRFEHLAAELEAHLDYEEEQVVEALNAIVMPG